ncbi:hypothetical protein [Streptomyces kebangsaanensis]|uniref:hypothetical protein n=1 Tax=Streptomyces kebangsaanensis TaxID=864058 RepID=UPI00093EAE26|nr:hypothetical protein [Streptomyces kebangsaanensis]
MSAMENNEQRRRRSEPRPHVVGGVSMRDLLASCAAAEAVSRPPRAPEPAEDPRTAGEHRQAA